MDDGIGPASENWTLHVVDSKSAVTRKIFPKTKLRKSFKMAPVSCGGLIILIDIDNNKCVCLFLAP
jgi:hypothetical protein